MGRYLIIRDTGGERRLRLAAPVYVVGRAAGCEVPLEDSSISRRHARLFVRASHCSVEDLGSSNGTFVNDRRVEREEPLAPGDRLRFGSVNASFVDDDVAEDAPAGVSPIAPEPGSAEG